MGGKNLEDFSGCEFKAIQEKEMFLEMLLYECEIHNRKINGETTDF